MNTDVFRTLMSLSVNDVAEAVGMKPMDWAYKCHQVSLAIVRSGLFEPGVSRVVRGTCAGVGQHSWVIVDSSGPYADDGSILDCTAWSYNPDRPYVYRTSQANADYIPAGAGDLVGSPCLAPGGRPPIYLHVDDAAAQEWMEDNLPPLDARGWASLVSHNPMGGWPSEEIVRAMYARDDLRGLVPIDVVANLTDLNPNDLYW